ncbi:hypothetical protein GGI21_003298, partial [Coemansia aciculifera]
LDHATPGHQSQPLGLPSPCRRGGSHKKQRLCERSSPPRSSSPPPEAEEPFAAAESPEHDTKSTLMEPPKTVKRGSGKHSSHIESPPLVPLEKPEAVSTAVTATDAPEPEASAGDGPSQKEPVASPAVERKKTPSSSAAITSSSKANASETTEQAAESSSAPVVAPDFGLSGKLAAETNTVNGVVLKYAEPPEARKPKDRWRLYVFKDGKDIDMHHVDKASGYLFGRDRKHAVLQPYLIDLSSTNGTFLNGDAIPTQRFVELRSEDVIKFGFSTREYVLLSE